jgi:RimK family alpha-L-glutamate ligase
MRIGLLSGGDGWHIQDLLRATQELGLDANLIDFRNLAASVGYQTNCIPYPTNPSLDAVLVRTMPHGTLEQVIFRMNVLHALQAKGIPIVNPPKALEICIDKYLCLIHLENAGLLVPKTIVCQESETAMIAYVQLGRDVVVKPIFGSEGRGMMRISDPELAWRSFRTLERMGAVLYLQEFIPHPGWDIRVFVLQGKILTAMKRINPKDWRTNVAQGATAEPIVISDQQAELALRAAKSVGVIAAGIDLLPGPTGEWYVIEVNGVPGWRKLAPVTGIDIAKALIRCCIGEEVQ